MSKMPAKKKSCFQITSVTPAQVAASSITDDTESLDDPDESRTEDVSSEIFDVSRTDFEPEACDRSSSEETLNNVGETEPPGAMPSHIPQDGQLPAATGSLNGGVSFRSVSQQISGTLGPAGQPPALLQQPASAPAPGITNVAASTSQPLPAPAVSSTASTATTSCSSRFRVIKLDHGTGEPFRRGRWTCVEYYDKDSEGAVGRSMDSLRHTSALDHSVERDSGLGATGGSVVVSAVLSGLGHDSSADGSFSAAAQLHLVDPPPQQPQTYSLGSVAHGAFQSPPYAAVPPQNLLPAGHNSSSFHVSMQHTHKSPTVPVTQAFTYAGQLPNAHQLPGQPVGQPEYRQPHLPLLQAVGAGASSQVLPAGAQGPPLVTPSSAQQGDSAGLMQQPKPTGQYQPSGGSPVASSTPLALPPQTPPSAGQSRSLGPFSSSPVEDCRRKPDVLPQAPVTPGKDVAKASNPESVPSVNTLFGIPIAMEEDDDCASGASVVAIDNKIEQAMDLVKSHLMYAVREEVEVLKEQIKELYERNSVLERENAVLKSLANSDQLSQLSQATGGSGTPTQQQQHPTIQPTNPPQEAGQLLPPQHNTSSA
ncbi:TSC22 domain family protein 2-like [Brienomyrus brachyistius]|uniref:TSC22 domain family protein 2-like n=1 Tax=Brienomyrus brachyistius TaxID=42636 RepID=UPI0020B1B442|nr:TSC22 domain family protein 2-like [Brienomyrus brachyistius]